MWCEVWPLSYLRLWLGSWDPPFVIAPAAPKASFNTNNTAITDLAPACNLFRSLPFLDYYRISLGSCHTPKSAMWDDEDNNPYGSFARHDSSASDVAGLASPAPRKLSLITLSIL
jgi:hypothetical protein